LSVLIWLITRAGRPSDTKPKDRSLQTDHAAPQHAAVNVPRISGSRHVHNPEFGKCRSPG
jgi:hypothetical protein